LGKALGRIRGGCAGENAHRVGEYPSSDELKEQVEKKKKSIRKREEEDTRNLKEGGCPPRQLVIRGDQEKIKKKYGNRSEKKGKRKDQGDRVETLRHCRVNKDSGQ